MQRLCLFLACALGISGLIYANSDSRNAPREKFIRRGIPIIYGYGETVSDLGKIPPGKAQELLRQYPSDVSVGFLHNRFHIYYANLWTWNGRHVLYSNRQYWTLTDSEWSQLLGHTAEKQYGRPFLYRFPLGLMIVSTIAAICIVTPILFPSPEKRLAKLSKNPQYMAALEQLFPPDKFPLQTTYEDRDFESAVSTLTVQGISDAKARGNLQLLAAAISVSRASRIDESLQSAAQFAEQGSPAEGLPILEGVLKELPGSDPHYSLVTEQMQKLREQAAKPAEDAVGAAEAAPAG